MEGDKKASIRKSARGDSLLRKRLQKQNEDLVRVNEALQEVIAQRRRAEQETRLLLSIIQAICDCEDFNSAIRVSLEAVCQRTGWQYAEAWIRRSDGEELECSPVWYSRGKGYEEFRKMRDSVTFASGVGLPGRVLKSKKPEWIEDVSTVSGTLFLCTSAAKVAGLKAALGVPILIGDEVLAVFVFFKTERLASDRKMVDLVSAIGAHLGAVMSHKRTDQALKESRMLLAAIVDQSSRVIYLKDLEGGYLLINTQYEKLFHVKREDLKGKTDYDIFPKEMADAFRANDLKMAEAGTAMEFEEVVRQDDGIHTYISNKFPIFNASGDCYAVCGISTDITDRKRLEKGLEESRDRLEEQVRKRTADLSRTVSDLHNEVAERIRSEQELRKSEERYRSLFETAGSLIVCLHPDGRIMEFNAEAERITGWRRGEVLGKDYIALFLPDAERGRVLADIAKVLGGVPTRDFVNLVRIRDGSERLFSWNATRLLDGDNRAIGIIAIGQDITDRKKAEDWLQRLIETTQDAVVSIDREGNIVLFNPAAERIFGYSRAEVEGRKVNILMAEPYAKEHDQYIARYEKTGERRAIGFIRTVAARRKSGEMFPIELSVAEVSEDEDLRYAAFIRDISEKARLQERLVENERLAAIGATTARIAHEVGNPLNGMYLTIQLLEQQLMSQPAAGNEKISLTVSRLKDEVIRLNQLVSEFRSVSRRDRYRFRPINISDIIREVMALEMENLRASRIEVSVEVSEDLPIQMADGDRLKQLLLNLVKNAMEAMPHGGALAVKAYQSSQDVHLEVADTGPGIPSEVNLFEPFSTSKGQGTGMGLVIARQIVSAHGGRINYTSSPSQGTTFRVTLPLKLPGGAADRFEGS